MNKKPAIFIIIGFLLVALGVGYLMLGQEKPVVKSDLEKVDVQLKWVHQSQFAGMYAAKEKGFYEEEGLDVSFIPYSFDDASPVSAVVDGRALFGVADSTQLITERQNGFNVKAIGVIFKKGPSTIYSLKENNIRKPKDLIGKTVGVQPTIDIQKMFELFLKKTDIKKSEVTIVDTGYDAQDLLDGKIDASTGYIINEPHQVIEAGYEVNTMIMADYGVGLYGDLLFTTDELILSRPDLVESFLRASLRGWQYAIENTNETVNFVLQYATDRTKSHETYMLNQAIPLVCAGNEPIGWMNEAEWERIQNILFDAGLILNKSEPGSFCTMQFLNRIFQ